MNKMNEDNCKNCTGEKLITKCYIIKKTYQDYCGKCHNSMKKTRKPRTQLIQPPKPGTPEHLTLSENLMKLRYKRDSYLYGITDTTLRNWIRKGLFTPTNNIYLY